MTTTAILLVAGVGRRLGANDRPKCLLPIDGRALIDHQIDALRQVGVEHLTLVVGHAEPVVRAATLNHPDLSFSFVRNAQYATSNTLWSLALASETLAEGAWVLNGDVLFDVRALQQVQELDQVATLAVDVRTCAEEEVKVRVDANGRVLALSKEVDPASALGESIGIARFGKPWAPTLVAALASRGRAEAHRQSYYEVAVEEAARREPLHVACLSDAPVIEIDFPEDLVRARQQIAPLLMRGSA